MGTVTEKVATTLFFDPEIVDGYTIDMPVKSNDKNDEEDIV